MNEANMTADGAAGPIDFGGTFVRSEAFALIFQEGMELVEDVAAYLDGPGRESARGLSRQATIAYTHESMRLTTRLMQIASWLLVQRALSENEISPSQARRERQRVRLHGPVKEMERADFESLPEKMRDFIGLAARLHARICHLDLLLIQGAEEAGRPALEAHPIVAQRSLIERAFAIPPLPLA